MIGTTNWDFMKRRVSCSSDLDPRGDPNDVNRCARTIFGASGNRGQSGVCSMMAVNETPFPQPPTYRPAPNILIHIHCKDDDITLVRPLANVRIQILKESFPWRPIVILL